MSDGTLAGRSGSVRRTIGLTVGRASKKKRDPLSNAVGAAQHPGSHPRGSTGPLRLCMTDGMCPERYKARNDGVCGRGWLKH